MRSLTGLLLCTFILYTSVLAGYEITSIHFVIKDEKYAIMEKSHLRAMNRSLKLFSMHIKLLQLPVRRVLVKWALLKHSNGYLPINQNYSVDACRFLRHSNHMLHNLIYNIFKDYTNLNHTCPFNHDVIVENFPSRSYRNFDFLFIAKGDYALDASWHADGVLRAESRVKFTLS